MEDILKKNYSAIAVLALTALAVSACGAGNDQKASANKSASEQKADKSVTLIAYDSFPTKDIKPAFEKKTGYKLKVVDGGDGAELTNKLVVSKGAPVADVALGMDNNVALTAADKDVFEKTDVKLPKGADKYQVKGQDALVPFDRSQYCLNLDQKWFKDKGKAEPTSFEDLTKPEYKNLVVVEDPRKSTPGMGLLTATIADRGENAFADYWKKLKDNGVEVTGGWTDAFAKFSTSEGGTKPVMAGYASSPAYPTGKDDAGKDVFNMKNVDSTCYAAVEYMSALKGAKNTEGAKVLMDYLLSKDAQELVSKVNYMYPVNSQAQLPKDLAEHGAEVKDALNIDPKKVADNRTAWLKTWADAMGM
ncbi:ABC transporter, substrate-binding protein, thiB family [Winkia neuii]|nr:ABC transporter, substrate-binding protein, thiB family [Winkia neuii]